MLIKQGLKQKKFLGIKRRINAPDFHETFGNAPSTGDFNLDSGLRAQPNQNVSDPIFQTFPQPEGCGGEGIASVMGDLERKLFNPWFSYDEMCQAEGQTTNNPVDLTFIVNEPVTSGVQDMNGVITKSPQWYEVKKLNGSLFQGIVSAMSIGKSSVAFASTWYQSFDFPTNGIVPSPAGLSSGHFWKFCGVKTINGASYLIAAPWLGPDWGEDGFCYFSQSIVDALDGQAFTPNQSGNTEAIPVSRETLLKSLINFMKELLSAEGGTVFTPFSSMEDEVEEIQEQINNLSKKSMEIKPAFSPMIVTWSQAIAHGEGASPASNNPGNLKYSTLTASWGATEGRAADDGGFLCQFSTLQQGQSALCNFLKLGAEDELVAFHEARTLQTFTVIYAGNPPQEYIDVIGEILGVPLDTPISTFLN